MNTLHVSILNPAIMNLKQPFRHPYEQLTLHRPNKRTLSINCVNNASEDEKISQPSDGIRFKRGSRRRTKEEGSGGEDGKKEEIVTKTWEEMTLNEKALELYVGEKGLLFWLNKLAYASIYIVIGGWILFRFVGPAFNLYQLDTPPLDPKSILKG